MQVISPEIESGIRFASMLPPRISYGIKEDAVGIAGSVPTAYRRLRALESLGLATVHRGQFQINQAARQPMDLLQRLIPSLLALKTARRFGRKYHISDVNFLKNNLPENAFVTLDYAAWDLTGYQTPMDLYVYVDDIKKTSNFLKSKEFSQGTQGRVVLLQKQHGFRKNTEQVYLDCIAKGGRSILDAIAIELKHGDKLRIKGRFNIEDVLKIQNDMQALKVE
jgi:hypothetical protein